MSDADAIPASATKITYIDGRPATITLRRCKLVVAREGQVEERLFDKDVVNIGAMEDNDLVLEDETVSRNHCRIFVEGDQYLIQDLDSTNGTFVNRVRIREAWLRPDVVITLGKTEIRFQPFDERVRIVPTETDRYGEIIGRDRKMREIYAILEKIAPTDATVVIEGETGTGKDVVARTIHGASKREGGPFMVFDCGAVPENLIESELFGHEKGSFTGAHQTRQGVFEMANGGTVFLDELGELQLDLQPKLLRVLEQREVKRIGGTKPIKVDVRIVAATNRNLEEEVRAGRFREDLFYRLTVVRLVLPPLRERRDDVKLLARHFLDHGHFNKDREGHRRVTQFAPGVLDRLSQYDWPGNVRELHNVIERAVSFSESDTVELADVPEHIAWPRGVPRDNDSETDVSIPLPDFRASELEGTFKDAKERWVASFERDYIAGLLKKNNGNISHAAREAEIDRKYFRKLMKKYGITAQDDDLDVDE
ncbi:sigma 54-interacting transcriptional regulator [Sandaracinus amylolyticus]|uniref:Formate hydrogenlyase transcriptional activator n=1 Tax=Sandaracinus amylolyticus TaxID=927083 RepID=A0A0F6YKK3_9BACT|nr:sigma 54-interacting transcriptional regulator [Sandaracinus amylolyticus]AKF08482.1 Formate hydrogenlyase transcriptional activator [Sandaracinus amylolyticus]